MNILIIYTHPNHESLNYSFLQATLNGLKTNQSITNIEVVDLYKEGFNPVLYFDKDQRRRDLSKIEELQPYRDQIQRADKLIFIYPIWWGRTPAMLDGYIDRIFTKDFAFQYAKNISGSIGLLTNKEVVCISTMKGPTFYPFFLLNNAHQALLRKALFNFVGIKKVKFFEFGDMEKPNGTQQKKLQKIQRYFETYA